MNCKFINCKIIRNKLSGCGLKNVMCDKDVLVDHVEFRQCTIIESDFTQVRFVGCTSAMPTRYSALNFAGAYFHDCDMKRNTFDDCKFDNATFDTCDARAAIFNNCSKNSVQNIRSMM